MSLWYCEDCAMSFKSEDGCPSCGQAGTWIRQVEVREMRDQTDELAIDVSGPIRRFSNANIRATIDKALESVPKGQNGAVVATVTTSGARMAVMGRFGDHWSVVGVLEKRFGGPLAGEAAAVFDW